MSYESCKIHDCDATNGCPQCLCKICGEGENTHTEFRCLTKQLKDIREQKDRLQRLLNNLESVLRYSKNACDGCGAQSPENSSTQISLSPKWLCSLCTEKKQYIPPILRKLTLEEKVINDAMNWQMVNARLHLAQKQINDFPHSHPIKVSEVESFYEFCVKLSGR